MQSAKVTKKNISKIGTILYNLRVEQDIRQDTVAAKINTYQSKISKIENNMNPGVSLQMITKYLDAIGYEITFTKK